MANINVTFTENTITVDEITSNVAVTETVSNIIVSSSAVASNADIRAAISNTSPITYNSTTGVIGIDSGAVFSGKTTDNLTEGTTNLYFTNARVGAYLTSNFTTTDVPEGANLYYTVARANAAFNNILTSNVVTFENGAVFNEGFRTPLYDAGSYSSGSVTLTTENGTAQEIKLTGNVGYVSWSDWQDGQVLHLVVKQDATGGRIIDFTNPNYATNGWDFLNASTTIDTAPNAETLITIQNFSSKRYATINTGNTTSLTNAQVVSYIATQPLTVGGNLTVTNNATITSNNLTVANILVPLTSYIKIPYGGNLFIGTDGVPGLIDVPSDAYQSIKFGKPIYSPYSANFEQGISADTLYATTSISTNYGNITSTYGNIQGVYIKGNGSQLTGLLTNAQVVSYIATQPLTVGGNLTVNGNINATGNINYQNVTDLYVTDQKITLNSNAATNANVEVIAYRPEATDTKLKWNEQLDRWEFSNDGTTYYPIPTSTSDLAEGTNLYYSNARVNAFIQDNITTSDIDEGTNLYYTTDRANTAIANKLIDSSQKKIYNAAIQDLFLTTNAASPGTGFYMPNSPGSIGDVLQLTGGDQADWQRLDTGDVDEGANLYYTTDRANTAIGNYQGNISTPGNVSAGNVITNNVYSNTGANLTVHTDEKLVITQEFKGETEEIDIVNKGYAFYNSRYYNVQALGEGNVLFTYSGSESLNGFIIDQGDTTAGSPVMSNVVVLRAGNRGQPSTSANISDVPVYSVPSLGVVSQATAPFPPGAYVVSTDEANGTITFSQPAATTEDSTVLSGVRLQPGAYDSNTGLVLKFTPKSLLPPNGQSNTQISYALAMNMVYGYPQTGPSPDDFVYSIGTSSDYAKGTGPTERYMVGKTRLEGYQQFLEAPRGLTIGDADMTSRAENDHFSSAFGINVLWDGLSDAITDYADSPPVTAIFLKQYSDNSLQDALNATQYNTGPRLMFSASEGNKDEPYTITYPRAGLELGRLSWWGGTSFIPSPSAINPPAWISGTAVEDFLENNSGVGMFFGNSPDITDQGIRGLYLGNSKGNTLISAGPFATSNVTIAPMHTQFESNSPAMFDSALSGTLFANIGYANTSAGTGSRITVTNGPDVIAPGDLRLEFDRNVAPATGTANVAVDSGYGIYDSSFAGGISDHAVVSIYYSGVTNIAPTTTAITFNNVTGPGAANINGQTFYINNSEDPYGYGDTYYLFTDSGLTTPALVSTLGAVTGSTGGGYFEYSFSLTPVSSNVNWSMGLLESSANLQFNANGSTVVSIETNGNINLATNASINYDEVYGCFHKTANVTAAAADTPYEFDWSTDTTVHAANRISISSNSHINFAKTGTYELCVQFQIRNDDNALRTAYIWLRKNGTDVEQSTTRLGIRPKGSAAASYQLNLLEWLVEANAGDYYELMFAVDDTSGISLEYDPAQVSPYARPAIPSAVLTVKPVGA